MKPATFGVGDARDMRALIAVSVAGAVLLFGAIVSAGLPPPLVPAERIFGKLLADAQSDRLVLPIETETSPRYLGALLADASEIITEVLEVTPGEVAVHGAVVLEVVPQGPAAQAGLLPGDTVVELGGEPIFDGAALLRGLHDRPAGTNVGVGYVRRGELRSATLKVIERPAKPDRLRRAAQRPTHTP